MSQRESGHIQVVTELARCRIKRTQGKQGGYPGA